MYPKTRLWLTHVRVCVVFFGACSIFWVECGSQLPWKLRRLILGFESGVRVWVLVLVLVSCKCIKICGAFHFRLRLLRLSSCQYVYLVSRISPLESWVKAFASFHIALSGHWQPTSIHFHYQLEPYRSVKQLTKQTNWPRTEMVI